MTGNILETIKKAERQDNWLRFTETLDRATYTKADEILNIIGYKWDKQHKAHITTNPEASNLLNAVLESGEVPEKNPTAYFPTPKAVIKEMFKFLDIFDNDTILEPSAGQGAIADYIREHYPENTLHCCEMLDLNRRVLENKKHTLVAHDFLQHNEHYDRIIMNPPFAVAGDATAWITHLLHAWDCLKHDGKIVCVVPQSFKYRSDKKHQKIRELVGLYGDYADLDKHSFAASGTNVATGTIYLHKHNIDYRDREFSGYKTFDMHLLFGIYIFNYESFYREYMRVLESKDVNKAQSFFERVIDFARKEGDWISWGDKQKADALAEFKEHLEKGI
jgi:16S rRNA G966 N2-methylase RsmD